MTQKIRKTEAEWQAQLSPRQYRVTRQKDTEPAFTGQYWNTHETGVFQCVCCGAALFDSDQKYDSGCGWPSFTAPVARENINETDDASHGMHRTEILCSQCDAHLGHVFADGPKPTGLRYCINSASLKLQKK
ncbi:MAG: peptide-methionine (R)-S-oxide reductase MsrB [Sterolibacterium sp.]|jgi:peptide-methionine (R)-S-oxide reductase